MSILIQDLLERLFKYSAYDENGQLTESFEVSPGSSSTGSPQVVGFSVELGRWHNTECLESGTVILECKDEKSFDYFDKLCNQLRNNETLRDEDNLVKA